MTVHERVWRWWQGGGGVPGSALRVAALPASRVFGALQAARNARYDREGPGRRVGGVTVVSVGNLAVGGTGKTPVVAWIAAELAELGVRPGVVSRGYGDELALHRRWRPGVPVVGDPDRIRAVERARALGAEVVVLDDGFQHRRLARDLDVVLVAAEDGAGARLLPAGPLREPLGSLARADVVVVTRRVADRAAADALGHTLRERFPGAVHALAWLGPAGWSSLAGERAAAPEGPVLAVSAVARPEPFRENVAGETGGEVEAMNFPDHHRYTARDVRRIASRAGGRIVVVTEKDAVKLEPFREGLGAVRVLLQRVVWEEGADAVRARLGSTMRGRGA